MAIHDWSRVEVGVFHAFHHDWITEISRALNHRLLPTDYYALPEQIADKFAPDVLLSIANPFSTGAPNEGGKSLAQDPPKVRIRMTSQARRYAAKADAVVVRDTKLHQIRAIIEIVSPGNKNSHAALAAFVLKMRNAMSAGVNLLVVDLFLPTFRDSRGIHGAIWGVDCGREYVLPPSDPLTCVSYIGGAYADALVDFATIGGKLPDMPLFLTPDAYVLVPLQSTYELAHGALPGHCKAALTEPAKD